MAADRHVQLAALIEAGTDPHEAALACGWTGALAEWIAGNAVPFLAKAGITVSVSGKTAPVPTVTTSSPPAAVVVVGASAESADDENATEGPSAVVEDADETPLADIEPVEATMAEPDTSAPSRRKRKAQ